MAIFELKDIPPRYHGHRLSIFAIIRHRAEDYRLVCDIFQGFVVAGFMLLLAGWWSM